MHQSQNMDVGRLLRTCIPAMVFFAVVLLWAKDLAGIGRGRGATAFKPWTTSAAEDNNKDLSGPELVCRVVPEQRILTCPNLVPKAMEAGVLRPLDSLLESSLRELQPSQQTKGSVWTWRALDFRQ
jgi:hypothetical protein